MLSRIVLVLLMLFCSSCASRPPVLATVGGVYVRATGRVDPLVGLVLPTQPVGFWASATYDIHAGTYGSVSVGITVPLVPGSAPPPKRGVEKQQ